MPKRPEKGKTMTETFKASNGWYTDENGVLNAGAYGYFADLDEAEAAERFFQEKRDAELGRWRDTVNPKYVVYPVGDGVVDVLRESGLSDKSPSPVIQFGVTREKAERWDKDYSQNFFDAALRYFQAHPQHKPLPTSRGIYANRRRFEHDKATSFIIYADQGAWKDALGEDALETAQRWNDAGELVRLAPVESEGE